MGYARILVDVLGGGRGGPARLAWPGELSPDNDSALEELRRRYAAGEIDDQYEHRRRVLTSSEPDNSSAGRSAE